MVAGLTISGGILTFFTIPPHRLHIYEVVTPNRRAPRSFTVAHTGQTKYTYRKHDTLIGDMIHISKICTYKNAGPHQLYADYS